MAALAPPGFSGPWQPVRMSPGRVPPPRALPLGAPAPVAPPSSGRFRCARPWPPSAPLGRCGPCPAALPPPRAPLPAWAPGPPARWPWLGPPPPGAARARGSGGSGGVPALPPAPGVASAYRRAACARRRGPGAPPAGPAAAWPVPAGGGLGSPPARPPPRGVWPSGSGRLPPPGGCAALLPPGGCAPSLVAPGPPARVPVGRPGFALGRRAFSLRGRLGAADAALCSAAAPSVGAFALAAGWWWAAGAGGPATGAGSRQGSR